MPYRILPRFMNRGLIEAERALPLRSLRTLLPRFMNRGLIEALAILARERVCL